jgi:PAS domain S-box-containing protein
MKHNTPHTPAELRRQAEERLQARGQTLQSALRDPHAEARLVHELQVHQIELEMQNEELRQTRARADALLAQYTDLYDFAPTGYLTLDREGAIRQANLTGALLLRVERSRLVNRRFGQFVAECDRRTFSDFLEKVFAGQAKESCEVTLLREDSEPFVAQLEGRRSEDGQECRAVVLDITERKRADEALRASQQLTESIIESIPGAFYMLDEAGRYVRWNAYQRDEIVGKPDDQIAGFPALDTIHPDDRALIQARVANVLRTGVVETVEGRVLLRGGPKFQWLLMTGRQLMVAGHPYLVGIGIDITARKEADAKLNEQLDELRRWQVVTLGREDRVQELKREVNEACRRLGTPARYTRQETGAGGGSDQ